VFLTVVNLTLYQVTQTILGVFAKLRKSIISFVVSVLSLCKEQPGSHLTDFHEIWNLTIFRKPVEKIKVLLKYKKNNRRFTWTPMYCTFMISLDSSSSKRKFSQTLYRKSEHTFYDRNYFPPENRVIYDTMWKNVVQPNRPQKTIWPIRAACRINTARKLTYSNI